ncbi:MAG TPA: preprotein translocase subunit SecG [Candidatus Binatia bacterium]|nr:preprotein translocase subunit SecG [Candidatus Binatia bacterium]
MIIVVTIIHVIVCIGLILVVLLQTGKGAEVGAVFGGSSSTIFGSSGAGNFLSRLTTGMAIVFMITSLTLGYFAGRKPSATIFDSQSGSSAPGASTGTKQEAAPVTPPAAPAQPAAPSQANPPEKTQSR